MVSKPSKNDNKSPISKNCLMFIFDIISLTFYYQFGCTMFWSLKPLKLDEWLKKDVILEAENEAFESIYRLLPINAAILIVTKCANLGLKILTWVLPVPLDPENSTI